MKRGVLIILDSIELGKAIVNEVDSCEHYYYVNFDEFEEHDYICVAEDFYNNTPLNVILYFISNINNGHQECISLDDINYCWDSVDRHLIHLGYVENEDKNFIKEINFNNEI